VVLFNHRWSSSLDWLLLVVDRVVVDLFDYFGGQNIIVNQSLVSLILF